MVIQIQISDEIWSYLNERKKAGESFVEVLERELKLNNRRKGCRASTQENIRLKDKI